MPYVIINPVNMTYDGGYVYKAHAEEMLQYCRMEYKQPATFMAFIDGAAADTLEPHFKWMADVELQKRATEFEKWGNRCAHGNTRPDAWTPEEDEMLMGLYTQGHPVQEIADCLCRTKNAVKARATAIKARRPMRVPTLDGKVL